MYAGHRQLEKIADEPFEIAEPEKEAVFHTPRAFRHEEALNDDLGKKAVSWEYLVNKLNYLHFTGKKAFASLHHPRYRTTIIVSVSPDPCNGKEIICRWSDDTLRGGRSEEYLLRHLIIEDRRNLLVVPAQISHRVENGFGINLPCECYLCGKRANARYEAPGVSAEINQDGWSGSGSVIDFSPRGIKLSIKPMNASSLHWFNCAEPLVLVMKRDNSPFFSGNCTCVRTSGGYEEKEIVVTPSPEPVRRFPKNQARNPRQHLVPPPVISFIHPMLNKRVSYTVSDLSTSGLSVWESAEEENLLKGMIINELNIESAGGLKMTCACQVIYRKEEGKKVKCGLAIIDMDINSYSRLSHMLSNAIDPNTHVSCDVDLDSLWEFFFSSGFIYSSKYKIINSNKESFRETYRKLYNEHPDIARHFTYQENGTIYGHISIIRAYPKTWMIHHHAALAHDSRRAGFTVLKHLMHNLNDMHRLPSARMECVLCYYRPDNNFPARVFGGFAEELNDRQGCSVDRFAYLPYTRLSLARRLQNGWSLAESSGQDLWEVQRAYENRSSGGLLLKALDISGPSDRCQLEEAYAAYGLKRKCRIFSLAEHGILKAVILVNESDVGINLSELLNCIQAIVLDPDGLPWAVLSTALGMLTAGCHAEKVPVMFYPHEYAAIQGVPYEKNYDAWVLNCSRGSSFMEYMQRRFHVRFK